MHQCSQKSLHTLTIKSITTYCYVSFTLVGTDRFNDNVDLDIDLNIAIPVLLNTRQPFFLNTFFKV